MQYPGEMTVPPRQMPQPAPAAAGQSFHLSSIGQLLVSTLGLAFFSMGFIGLLLTALISLGSGGEIGQTASLFGTAWTSAGVSLLMVPSIVYAILRLRGKATNGNPFRHSGRFVGLGLFLFSLVLVVGILLTSGDGAGILLASPLHLLVVGIPLWALFELSTRDLKRGSPQRGWGILSFGLTVTPLAAVAVELVVLLVVVTAAVVWAVKSDPANMALLNRLQMRLASGGMNSEALQRLMQSFINQPLVLYTTFSIFCVFIPMIEEILKPLALLFLIRRRLSPMEGFAAGLVSGLAFSLIESSNAMAMSINSSWGILAIGRLGAGLLHMTTAGLMGWALASAFTEGRYFRLAFSFLLAISLHGLWNGLTLITVVGPYLPGDGFLKSISSVAPLGLAMLMGSFFLMLLGWNRILKRPPAGD